LSVRTGSGFRGLGTRSVETFFSIYLALGLQPKLFFAAFRTAVLLPKFIGAESHFLDVELFEELASAQSVGFLSDAIPFVRNLQPGCLFSAASSIAARAASFTAFL